MSYRHGYSARSYQIAYNSLILFGFSVVQTFFTEKFVYLPSLNYNYLSMRAPFSQLAKKVLDNPDSAKALKDFLRSRNKVGEIEFVGQDGKRSTIRVERLNDIAATDHL